MYVMQEDSTNSIPSHKRLNNKSLKKSCSQRDLVNYKFILIINVLVNIV